MDDDEALCCSRAVIVYQQEWMIVPGESTHPADGRFALKIGFSIGILIEIGLVDLRLW